MEFKDLYGGNSLNFSLERFDRSRQLQRPETGIYEDSRGGNNFIFEDIL